MSLAQLSPPVRVDADKIFALIRERDPSRGGVSRFARSLGRNPGTFWNLKSGNQPRISIAFATQLTEALGLRLSEITVPDEAPQAEDPQQQAEVA